MSERPTRSVGVSAVAAVLAATAALALAACGSNSSSSGATASTAAAPASPSTASNSISTGSPTTVAPITPVVHHHVHPRPPDPGKLPQTAVLPFADTAGFHHEMAAFWRGVQTGRTAPALPAFFPESAYVQLKTLGDPAGDWLNRLVGDYGLDLAAAHALLGSDPPGAQLVTVIVARDYAHWVPPGVCDNSVGYYEVPHSRVVYRLGGAERSFGIASMISWRGVWYIVHLGAVLRDSATGVVDDPEAGSGAPTASSTC